MLDAGTAVFGFFAVAWILIGSIALVVIATREPHDRVTLDRIRKTLDAIHDGAHSE